MNTELILRGIALTVLLIVLGGLFVVAVTLPVYVAAGQWEARRWQANGGRR